MAICLGPTFGLGAPIAQRGDLKAQKDLWAELVGMKIASLAAFSQEEIVDLARRWNLAVGDNVATNARTMICEIVTLKLFPFWLVQRHEPVYSRFWDMGGNERNIEARFGDGFELVADTLGATLVVRREKDDWHFQIQTCSNNNTLPLNPEWVEITKDGWSCRKYQCSRKNPRIPIIDYGEVARLGINPSVFNLTIPKGLRHACLLSRKMAIDGWYPRHQYLLARARGYKGEILKEWISLLLRSEGFTEEEINSIDG